MLQEHVSRLVAQTVVDLLETVEVEQEQGEALAACPATGPADGGAEDADEAGAVGQTRELVALGQRHGALARQGQFARAFVHPQFQVRGEAKELLVEVVEFARLGFEEGLGLGAGTPLAGNAPLQAPDALVDFRACRDRRAFVRSRHHGIRPRA